jgi:hypothetical protein
MPIFALVWELVVLPTGSRAHHRPTCGEATSRAPPPLLLGDQNSEAASVDIKSVEQMDKEGKKKSISAEVIMLSNCNVKYKLIPTEVVS